MRRVLALIRKELLQLRRDPRLLSILFAAPVLQLALLGYAATTDLHQVPVVVCDLARCPASRDLVAAVTASGDFRVRAWVDAPPAIDAFLDGSRADLALIIPADFGHRLAAGRDAAVQVLADGTRVTAALALGQLGGALARFGDHEARRRLTAAGRHPELPAVELRPRVWYNPELSSRNFMVPGVLGLVLMVITTVVTSMAVVRERETGTIEQIIVSPLRPAHLILGKLLPYALIGLLETILVLIVALLWFRVPLRGSLTLLIGLSTLFMLSAQAIGLLVSTVSHTQQQAMMTAVFFVILPMMLLSGFAFAIEGMPAPVQYVTYLLPLRYYLVIVRGIFLKGVGWHQLWPQAAALAAFATVLLGLAVVRFRKRLG